MRHVSLGLVLALAATSGCKRVTVLNAVEEPVLSVVGHPPALPPVPEPPPPPPPPPPKVELGETTITLLEPIVFGPKDVTFHPSSEAVLGELAALLEASSELELVSIEVHTDPEGPRGKNKKLSKKRAEALVAWLVDHGVDEERLTTKAWGESKPLPEAESDEQHRRVEVLIVKRAPPPEPTKEENP